MPELELALAARLPAMAEMLCDDIVLELWIVLFWRFLLRIEV